jgi:hypothetical protein
VVACPVEIDRFHDRQPALARGDIGPVVASAMCCTAVALTAGINSARSMDEKTSVRLAGTPASFALEMKDGSATYGWR